MGGPRVVDLAIQPVPPMLELLQFHPAFGLMNPSPFCMKVEVFLRLSGLPYRCRNGEVPLRMPKRKLPVLRDGDLLICDSQAILVHLQQRYGAGMPASLTAPETAGELVIRRTLEEHTLFAGLWLRWVDPPAWPQLKEAMFGKFPVPLRWVVPPLVRRKIRRDIWGQGVGRHSREDIVARAKADLDAVVELLGPLPYFGGQEPGALDATVYAFAANMLWAPIDSPLRAHARAQPRLVAYAQRMRERVGAC